jgi:hypothetical protein
MITFDPREEGHMLADSMKDLTDNGWHIMQDEAFKPGVRRVFAVHHGAYGHGPHESRIFYVTDTK